MSGGNVKRILIIAGEASGDLHGAGVIRELKKSLPDCMIYGIGGDKMRGEGMELIYHIREVAVMGFWEVLQNLHIIKSVEKTLSVLLKVRRPDAVLLIDYPGFNLRFAAQAKNEGIKVIYYISPQVWAWNPGRVEEIKKNVDAMLVVFPFEVDFYAKKGLSVDFVGNPLLEAFTEPLDRKQFCTRFGLEEDKLILGLFPGSRRQELEKIFPSMLGAARILHASNAVQTVVGVSSALDVDYVKSFLRDDFPVTIVHNVTYDLAKNSDCAIVTSGTATLEIGYYQTPMVIVYRTSWLTYIIGRLLVKIKNIGLVNIVAGEKIVPELIQMQVRPDRIVREVKSLIDDDLRRKEISQKLGVIREKLGTKGASKRVAEKILSYMS
jgi:lipid-A-disaccharide synthase